LQLQGITAHLHQTKNIMEVALRQPLMGAHCIDDIMWLLVNTAV